MKLILKYSLLLFLLSILFLPELYLPIVHRFIPGLQAKKLGGSYKKITKPAFSSKDWLSKSYQDQLEVYLKSHSENAPFFVRLRNQNHYSIFNELPSRKIHAGKNNVLHDVDYTMAYTGYKCCDEPLLEEIAAKLRRAHQLLQERNITLLVLLPPGKARVMPENIPDYYQKNATEASNWHRMRYYLSREKVPFMDFAFLIEQHKSGTHDYPLFPQLGLHWSHYCAALVADSLKARIEQLLSIQLPVFNWKDSIIWKETPKEVDMDLLISANLLPGFPIEPMPYPQLEYITSDSTTKPNVLVVGDSFYKVLVDYGIQKGLFHKESSFWYYNASGDAKNNLLKHVEQRAIILLPHAEINITSMGFGFLDQLLEALE